MKVFVERFKGEDDTEVVAEFEVRENATLHDMAIALAKVTGEHVRDMVPSSNMRDTVYNGASVTSINYCVSYFR